MITFRALPIELLEARAELLVCYFFADLIPLRGDASCLDWRLNGQVSQLLVATKAHGDAGEAVLLPSRGKVWCPKVLLLGLGNSYELNSEQVIEHCSKIIEIAAKLQLTSLATGVVGRDLQGIDYEQLTIDMVDGLLMGCNRLYPNDNEFTITFVENDSQRFDAVLKSTRFAIESFSYRFLADRDKSYIGGNSEEN